MNSLAPQSHIEGPIPNGLILIPNFLTTKELRGLEEWTRERVKGTLAVGGNMRYEWFGAPHFISELPEWSKEVSDRLQERQLFTNNPPNSMLLIQYAPGVGNTPHVDEGRYGEVIAGLSLGETCVMRMKRLFGQEARLLLEPGSLYAFTGESRWDWTHGISKETSEIFQGKEWRRNEDRFSYTFRNLTDLSHWQ